MESLIPIINQLQEVISLSNVKTGIELPRIIVVGSQSSGKSSVLESIVGKDFLPRGSGIVTRCPLILRLIKTDSRDEYATFHHIPKCRFEDFKQVYDEIVTVSKEIADTEGISTREILLDVYSPNVVDLTLIDLPGIIRVPLAGQSKNLDKRINEMILEYAKEENSIILAISPANSDLANSDALNVARMVDPDGCRTIGVITKIDLMDRGTNALEMIEGKLYPLKLGYVGIICRSQEDINNGIPLGQHLLKEKNFFERSPIYAAYTSRLGISYLSQRLSMIFKQHIQVTIPKIKREISAMLEKTNKELLELGRPLETKEQKSDLIYKIISQFCGKYENSLDGKDLSYCVLELSGGSAILQIFKNFFNEIIGKIDPLSELSDYQIRVAIMNATGSKGVLFFSEVAFENLLGEIIQRLKIPSFDCLELVKEELQKILNSIHITEFDRFPKMREYCLNIGCEVIMNCLSSSEKNIENIIEIESNFLNISHPDFINPNEAMLMAHTQLEEAAKRPRTERVRPPEPKAKEGFLSGWFSYGQNAEVKAVFEEIGSKEQEVKRILDEEMSEKELEQNILIKNLINSYFEITKFNIGDSVPKSIMRNLVNESRQSLQRILTQRLYNSTEIYDSVLDEDSEIKANRANSMELKRCLETALAIVKDVLP